MSNPHYEILIVGGGTAGITVAARLSNLNLDLKLGLIEPSDKHYYQPIWTLVGGGVFDKSISERPEADYIPYGTTWIRDFVERFDPVNNQLITRNGTTYTYDYLVVAAGIQLDWDKVKGLKETLGKNQVCSNYDFQTVDYTWESVKNFTGGTALFTHPASPIKCGGAPQKAMYLTEDYFRKKSRVRDKTKVVFCSGLGGIFGVPKYKAALEKVLTRKGITDTHYLHDLIEVRGEQKEAVFRQIETGEEMSLKFDLLHVVPHQSAPDFIKKSPLADAAGWVEVDQFTTQHTRFPNVFSLGDCSNLPAARTGAAIRKQAPVLVENLIAHRSGQPLQAQYHGYSSCPLVTGYGSLILAEFDYSGQPTESFPFDQSQERLSMYLLKAYALPQLYWNGMLRGQM